MRRQHETRKLLKDPWPGRGTEKHVACLQSGAQQICHLVHHRREVAGHQLLGTLQQRLLKHQRPQRRRTAQHPLADVTPGHGRHIAPSICCRCGIWPAAHGTQAQAVGRLGCSASRHLMTASTP